MYAALLLSAATTVGTVGIPFFHRNELIAGIPIQTFGVIVAAGVLIGAAILRRYAEWHGVSDDHIRGLTGWITVTGFIGAHVFDVLAYQLDALQRDPLLLIKIWSGISSYGGFIGGAMGFAFYVWWKRLPARLMADIAIIGLLPAFSIGRIGCTVVSDHVGAAVDPTQWYAALAMAYPRDFNHEVVQNLVATHPGTEPILAWNLGFIELLYLIPVNALILWLGFRKKRVPAGLLVVLTGVLYAPVRFFLEYLRPESSDPRHLGMTFAQWASMLAFGASVYLAVRLIRSGKPAEPIAPTSREAQQKLQVVLKEDVGKDAKAKKSEVGDKKPVKAADKPDEPDPIAVAKRLREEQDEAEAAERRRKQDAELEAKNRAKVADDQAEPADDGAAVAQDEVAKKKPASKPKR